MKYHNSSWMGRTKTIDPKSLAPGDKVRYSECDTSATAVYGFDCEVLKNDGETLLVRRDGNWVYFEIEKWEGCYSYFEEITEKS